MKFKHEDTIIIPIPEQFQKAWQPILHDWFQKNHQNYPNAIIEDIEPDISYYRRSDGESMMSGDIVLTVVTYKDVTDINFHF